jgi:hypothetical protein
MTIGNHDEGFEKEVKLKAVYVEVNKLCEHLYKWGKFIEVARLINPELCERAFDRRPCCRKLRYIGHDNWPDPTRVELNAESHDYFVYGQIYISTDFNGATYSVEGYSDCHNGKVIGCAYFEWLKDEAAEKE